MTSCTFRWAVPTDWEAIAALHAASWQTAYRGILSDEYLDHQAIAERRAKWEARLLQAVPPRTAIVLAEASGHLLGFCSVILDEHEQYGALIDNLHVHPTEKGRGLGRQLLSHAATWAEARRPGTGLYLFVFAANTSARAFYRHLGGVETEFITRTSASGFEGEQWLVIWPCATSLTLKPAVDRPNRPLVGL